MIMQYVFLILAFVINATASILLKLDASSKHESIGALGWQGLLSYKFFFLGILAFAVNVIFYWLSLKVIPLSVAYPVMVAGSFIIVNLFAAILFHENISFVQLIGYLFILIGALIVLLDKSA